MATWSCSSRQHWRSHAHQSRRGVGLGRCVRHQVALRGPRQGGVEALRCETLLPETSRSAPPTGWNQPMVSRRRQVDKSEAAAKGYQERRGHWFAAPQPVSNTIRRAQRHRHQLYNQCGSAQRRWANLQRSTVHLNTAGWKIAARRTSEASASLATACGRHEDPAGKLPGSAQSCAAALRFLA